MGTYSPKKIVFSVAGQAISGYADDSFIKVERNADAFTHKVGCDGEVGRSLSADNSGTITLTLLQTAASNDLLSALHEADRISANGKFVAFGEDKNGTSVFGSGEAWIPKLAAIEEGAEIGTREWRIVCADLNMFVGGND